MLRTGPGGLAVFALAAICGCSGQESTYEVTGKVTMADGSPLNGGMVVFQAPRKPPAKGSIQPDGTYKLGTYEEGDGAVAGTHQVTIVPPTPPNWNEKKQGVPPDVFDPKYRSFTTSGLTCDVTDDRTFDIGPLDPPPPPPDPPKKKRGTRRR